MKFEVVCANKSLHPFKQITTKPSALFNVRAESVAVNTGRITIADAEGNSFELK